MGVTDQLTNIFSKLAPSRHHKPPAGIGSGHGMVPFDDEMIVSRPSIIFHSCQIFFNFLAMACFASVASFQAKYSVGPSGLSGFAVFVSLLGIVLPLFLVMVPVLYEKYDKFVKTARALKEVRVGFILTGAGTTFSLLIAFITTISAWTQPGCKDPESDPSAKEAGKDFVKGLPGWCSTKKAGAIFFWLAFIFWAASLGLLIYDWRSGKLGPRDPPFVRPTIQDDVEDVEVVGDEDGYQHIPPARPAPSSPGGAYGGNVLTSPFSDNNRYSSALVTSSYSAVTPTVHMPAVSRPSMDAYGAFSDPLPSGYGTPPTDTQPIGPPILPAPDLGPRVSRTMQYADPYAAVHASIQPSPSPGPAGYDNYSGYR